ncbi:sulfolipid-1 biosynthesis phthioceranic/hydroxyphthioceranic acid synthase [Mycobacterium szulgai]|nr:type I polyketide synthase [Mycobacterium szulgai]MCV7076907.1 type I polyketide synthase [Mycobacterium szulgai]
MALEKPVTPIAVIGMACRLPGGIDSPELLWQALLRGDDLVTKIPLDRWDADDYYDPEPGVPGRSVSKWGSYLDDVAGFDSAFFGITEREATSIDPQHRLLLETAWEAMEHAGLTPEQIADSPAGVFVGLTHSAYTLLTADAQALEKPHALAGTNFSLASGRIAYALGIHGPAVTVDTACSSGLLAVHLACRSLHEGETNLAFAGGVFLGLDPRQSCSASALGVLSPTGRCHAFDAAADGFVWAEGSVVLLFKRLPDALRDGDRILAVVRGTAANQDGRTVNIHTPSEDAQVAVYRAALVAAGVDARSVGMVEAHGTGTPVGDGVEYASLATVYGTEEPCALASVKTNFGHAQSAAGALGLMKAVLALRHGAVPRNLRFNRLPDDLAAIETKLFVPQTTTSWPGDGLAAPRRAAVSAYGISGTNAHAIVEQAPETAEHEPRQGVPGPLLFALSSTSPEELRRTAGRLAGWVEEHQDDVALPDLAYTLARRRAHRPVRTAVIAGSVEELTEGLREIADGDTAYQPAFGHDSRGPVWVFSGHGSQWAAMGAELLAGEPVFAATVAQVEPLIMRESGFSVIEAMTAPHKVTEIDRVQPTLFTMQVALAAAMKSYGVRPGAVIGHSLGEVAAAVVAGALSVEDGVRVVCCRSRLITSIAGSGAMASVELPAKTVYSELIAHGVTDVVIAVVASPQSTVIGGDAQTVRELVAAWEQRDVMAREVAIDAASHTPQVDPILDELADALVDLTPMTPEVPYYSATAFDPREPTVHDAGYWVNNLRRMVRFSAAVQAALEDGHQVFAELSPHPLLIHAVDQTAKNLDMSVAMLAGMRREQPLPHGLRGLLVDLHSAGAAIDFSVLYPVGRLLDAPLPTWTHRHLFVDRDGADRRAHAANTVAVHPLLGSHVRLMEEADRHAWHGEVGTKALPWLGDHQIHQVASLPGAAYCEMALAAARAALGAAAEVRDIRFEQMLLLDDRTEIGAVASVDSPGVANFVVETVQDGDRNRHATAMLHAAEDDCPPTVYDIAALLAAHPHRSDGTELREFFDKCGIQFGPAFTGLATVRTAEHAGHTVLAEVELPSSIRSQQSAYEIHPALLDACFQSIGALRADATGSDGLLLPLGVRRMRAFGPTRNARYCYANVRQADATEAEADLDLLDEHGTVLLSVQGLQVASGVSGTGTSNRLLNERLLSIEWQQRTLPEVALADATTWLLISISDVADQFANNLTDALKSQRAQCTTLHWPQEGEWFANPGRLGAQLRANPVGGVVVLYPPAIGDADEGSLLLGREQVGLLVRIARELADLPGDAPRLYVVTRQAEVVLAEDNAHLVQAGLRGLIRVIGAECPQLQPVQIDVDEHTDTEQLAQQLLGGSREDETAWRNGEWYTARLCLRPLGPEDRRTAVVRHGRDGIRMQIRTRGDLQTMELVAFERVSPGPGEIEVAVTASSINFADTLSVFARFDFGMPTDLGTDFAGVVSAVGPGVTELRVGDRVGGFSGNGCWASFVVCAANQTAKIPPGLTDAQAAAVGAATGTAWYGLHDLARIQAGEKVLIHSGTGGVGQAAIAIARAAGAEIFATAGSPKRRQILRDMGIEHVYDSRTVEFAEQIRRDTGGQGVDIVLNSLPGAAQRAGLDLLTYGGRFVEIGKRDIYTDNRLGLFPFRRNLTFFALDLWGMTATHPERVRKLTDTVYRLTADGSLPMPEITHYPLAEAATAVRVMGAAEHRGKLILDIPQSGNSIVVLPPEQVGVFRPDGAYIITGGLGGLGLFLAEKMARAGAGRIVLNSRSIPSQKISETVELIRASGTDIAVECGDISAPDTAERLVAVATATGLPVRGVLHGAAVVEDATLDNITEELIDCDWAPKVYGAWHLHRATATQPLDWFCAFSSAAALLGSPGQGAYAAANSWLDGFTHWRRAQGLPATAIAWGAWAEIGRAAFMAARGDANMILPDEGSDAFETLLRHDRTYTGYLQIAGAPWAATLAERSRFAEALRAAEQIRLGAGHFRAELDDVHRDEWPARLRRLVAEQVSLILRRSIDLDRRFDEYGVDSLGALELRTRIETETGIRISPKDIVTHNTVRALAQHLSDTLAAEDTVAAPA